MTDVNSITLTGRLVQDASCRQFENSNGVVNFTVATNRSIKTANGWEEKPSFIDCKYFTKGLGICEYLKKGTQVAIQGNLEQESWTTKEGNKQSRIVINVGNLKWYSTQSQSPTTSRPQNNPPQQNTQSNSDNGFPEELFY